MIAVWTHFLSALVFVVLAAGSLYTSAYFFDFEMSSDSTLGATSLSGLTLGEPFNEFICSTGTTVESEFTFQNENALPFAYDIASENFFGSGCGDITLTAFKNEGEVYSGPLGAFSVIGFDLEPGGLDTWRLVATKQSQSANNTSCTFDTVFPAYQQGFESGEAFHDIESITHSITASSTLCAPTVLLQMDKHISGDGNGFEESDFSFRVVGEGVDVIIPHGGSYPLSIGTYTIEELAPDGFLHEDWRIGWYGECERGSDFTTTITIDGGNIDHGWLDCQADNQYRPDHRRSEHSSRGAAVIESVTQTTETSQSSQPEPEEMASEETAPETVDETETEEEVEEVVEVVEVVEVEEEIVEEVAEEVVEENPEVEASEQETESVIE